ncbi:MAG: hypothetical protein MUC95_06520 [Spirochaetes bacterium]|jgi:hypothetical protein|nr:hypothetical protein [Spirochaetota bacterium]
MILNHGKGGGMMKSIIILVLVLTIIYTSFLVWKKNTELHFLSRKFAQCKSISVGNYKSAQRYYNKIRFLEKELWDMKIGEKRTYSFTLGNSTIGFRIKKESEKKNTD